MVENLKEHSLSIQIVCYNIVLSKHPTWFGGLLNVVYTKELLLSATAARQKYQMYSIYIPI